MGSTRFQSLATYTIITIFSKALHAPCSSTVHMQKRSSCIFHFHKTVLNTNAATFNIWYTMFENSLFSYVVCYCILLPFVSIYPSKNITTSNERILPSQDLYVAFISEYFSPVRIFILIFGYGCLPQKNGLAKFHAQI